MMAYHLHIRFCILVGVLAFAMLACGCSTDETYPLPTPIEDIGVTLEPDPWWEQMLDGCLVNEIGGYEILGIPGQILIRDAERFYTNAETVDFDLNNDLSLFVTGSVSLQPITLEQIYAEALSELGVNPAKPEGIRIADAPGLSVEFTRTLPEGSQMVGRLVVVQVNPFQRFIIVGEGAAEAWETDLELIFEAVLASIRFFEPE